MILAKPDSYGKRILICCKDLDINVAGDLLSIKGEKKEEEEKKDEGYHFRESYFGSFQRNIRLPSKVQNDKVEAKFKDGVLNITLPKSEETKPNKIQIQYGKP